VKYELHFYIPEDAIFHSDRRENLKSYLSNIVPLCRIPYVSVGYVADWGLWIVESGQFPVAYFPTLKMKVIQSPWPLVRKRTIPTERPPLVDEI
jgi:hypothetical protein